MNNMKILMLLPLICMSSCSSESGGPTTVGELASMVVAAPAILPIAAIHYSVPVEGDKRLSKWSVRGKWYQSLEDIPDKPYIEFHGTRGMVLPSHDIGDADGTVSRGSKIGTRSPGKEDFWEVSNIVFGYHRYASIVFHYHDRDEKEKWAGVQISGKEMTGSKTVGGYRRDPSNEDKYVDFRLYRK